MTESFIEINSKTIELAASQKLDLLQKKIDKDKEEWFTRERNKTKKFGFLWLNSRQLTEEEIEYSYKYGTTGFWSAWYEIEGMWIPYKEKLSKLIDLAKSAESANGTGMIYLSNKDHALIFSINIE